MLLLGWEFLANCYHVLTPIAFFALFQMKSISFRVYLTIAFIANPITTFLYVIIQLFPFNVQLAAFAFEISLRA